jgi:hypothetical protein
MSVVWPLSCSASSSRHAGRVRTERRRVDLRERDRERDFERADLDERREAIHQP